MGGETSHRIRLKLPNGAELEAEGSADFVAQERRDFVALHLPRTSAEMGHPGNLSGNPVPPWETLIEARGSSLQLRAKLRGDKTKKDACLVLLAAAKALLRISKPTAGQLARWLRVSGYPIARVDRALQEALDRGEILATGSRRARRYELSTPGLAKAYGLAFQLAALIRPFS